MPGEVVFLMEHVDSMLDVAHIQQQTQRDPALSLVFQYIQRGWPARVQRDDLRPYISRRAQLSSHDGCVLLSSRLVVPPSCQGRVMDLLHETHPGISRMKALARSYIWWPGMDLQLEEQVQACQPCQLHQKNPAQAPLHPWVWPTRPWARLHLDYARPFLGKMFLVTVDAHSKWLDVHPVTTATSSTTIAHLCNLFATHGLPETIVTDNGSVFTSAEFNDFPKGNGIQHTTSAPFHPPSNGLAERAIQSFKSVMRKQESGILETKLARFMFQYHITSHATTREAPAQLLMGRQLHSRLSVMHPNLERKVERAQSRQKVQHDSGDKPRHFQQGDPVYMRNYTGGSRWLLGTVLEETGPSVGAQVDVGGTVHHRHHDQLRPHRVLEAGNRRGPTHMPVGEPERGEVPEAGHGDPALEENIRSPERRYPARDHQLPSYLNDYKC